MLVEVRKDMSLIYSLTKSLEQVGFHLNLIEIPFILFRCQPFCYLMISQKIGNQKKSDIFLLEDLTVYMC